MRLYHRTDHTDAILRDGFQDGTGSYGTDREWSGVWLSDRPLDVNEGADGEQLLELVMPDDVVAEWEWQQDIGYREFLVPATVVNRYGPPRVVPEEEES